MCTVDQKRVTDTTSTQEHRERGKRGDEHCAERQGTSEAHVGRRGDRQRKYGIPGLDELSQCYCIAHTDLCVQIINKMHTEKDMPDSELRIGGAQVTRAQYNVVYLDLIEYLNDIERHTGQRPQVVELGDNVVLESSAEPERQGTYTKVYRGYYLGKPVSAIDLSSALA